MVFDDVVVPFRRRKGWVRWVRWKEEREGGREGRKGRVEGFLRGRGREWGMRCLREMVMRRREERGREGRAVVLWEGGGEGKIRRRWRRRRLGRAFRRWFLFHQQQRAAERIVLAKERALVLSCLRQWRRALRSKQQEEWEEGALRRLFLRWHRRAAARAGRRARMSDIVGGYVCRVGREGGMRGWKKWMEGRRVEKVVVGERKARGREGGRRVKMMVSLRKWRRWVQEKQRRRDESEGREGLYYRKRMLTNAMYGWRERCRGRRGRESWMLLAERWRERGVLREGVRERWGAWVGGREGRERRRKRLGRMEERAGKWREGRWVRRWQRWRYLQEFVRGQEEMAVEWERRRRMEGGREGGRGRKVEISGRGFFVLLRRLVFVRQQQRQALIAAEQARELMLVLEGWRRWVRRVRAGRKRRREEDVLGCWEGERRRKHLYWWRWREWVRRRREGRLVRALRGEVELFRLQQQQQQQEEEEGEEMGAQQQQQQQQQQQWPGMNEQGDRGGGGQEGPRIVRRRRTKTKSK